jgi:hypothetical protein
LEQSNVGNGFAAREGDGVGSRRLATSRFREMIVSLVGSMGARCALALALLVGLAGVAGVAGRDRSGEGRDGPAATAVRGPLPIERAGRLHHQGRSALAHDGDPTTTWTVGEAPVSARFDLGAPRRLVAVRWLPASGAPVEVQRSRDRERWVTVGRVGDPEAGAWQEVAVGRPARYVRFVFDDGDDAAAVGRLAEVEVHGRSGGDDRSVPREQRIGERGVANVDGGRAQRPERGRVAGGRDHDRDRRPARQAAGNVAAVGREGNGAVVIGDRTIEDQARVVEGCGDGSSDCRIEIDVSAGTAVCDESGGDGNIVRGRGRANAGQGGSCSRDASGGTVEIGDVNP